MRRGPAVFLLVTLLLASAYGAVQAIHQGWQLITGFLPAHYTVPRPTIGSTPLSNRLIFITIDGLRPDDASLMPTLDWLRRRGAGFALSVPMPAYGLPALATLLSGAPPTLHGVLIDSPGAALRSDNFVSGATQMGYSSAGIGGVGLGGLIGPPTAWQTADTLESVMAGAQPLVAPTGPRLALIQIEAVHHATHQLSRPDRSAPEFRNLLAQLDGYLIQLLEQVDLKTTAVVITGGFPSDSSGAHPATGTSFLILAGAGIKPDSRGEANLRDIAPTVSVLLGVPSPIQSLGRPLYDALLVDGRPRDAIEQRIATGRKAFFDAALQSVGSVELTPQAPGSIDAITIYLERANQLLRSATFAYWKSGVLDRLPFLGPALLVGIMYLVIVLRQPFAGPLIAGILTYVTGFHVIFFATGGRYSAAMAQLESFDQGLALGVGLRTAAAMAVALILTSYLLARRDYKRPSYMTSAALHMALTTIIFISLPVVGAVAILGWTFPVELPSMNLMVWFFVWAIQVVVIGALSPIWAVLGAGIVRLTRHRWPLKEIGDPVVNADKVLRLRALRRSSRK